MSNLYAKITSDTKKATTRTAHTEQEAWVQTKRGRITVSLSSTGRFIITMQAVRDYGAVGPTTLIATGNADEQAVDPDEYEEQRNGATSCGI